MNHLLALVFVTFSLVCGTVWGQSLGSWQRIEGNSPNIVGNPGVAFDEARNEMVIFGGQNQGTLANSGATWVRVGDTWQLASTTGPSPRSSPAMVYDSLRQRVLLYGGQDSSGIRGDTWAWDGTAWTLLSNFGPGPRVGASMAYDRLRDRVVLFGGVGTPGGPSRTTWEWIGFAWIQVGDIGPRPLEHSKMVYDESRGKTVLFGGNALDHAQPLYPNETWEWNGSAWTSSPNSKIRGRSGHGMIYDSSRQKVVVYAGGQSQAYDDMWELGASGWVKITTPATDPMYYPSVAYDKGTDSIVLYGGLVQSANGDATASTDTWEWKVERKCPADFNDDGGIDGMDIEEFFLRWENGC